MVRARRAKLSFAVLLMGVLVLALRAASGTESEPPGTARQAGRQAARLEPSARQQRAAGQPAGAAGSRFRFAAQIDDPAIGPLMRQMFSDRELLRAELDRAGTFRPGFLGFVARRYAHRIGRVPAGRRSLGGQVLAGLNGRPTALALVYGVERGSPGREAAARQVAQRLREAVRLLNEAEFDSARGVLQTMNLPESFRTLVVGATPRTPSLVSWRHGLPPAVFGPFARKMVADEGRLAVGDVEVERAFYEPRLPKGLEFGILLRSGPAAGRPAADHVYLAPSSAFPLGRALSRDHYSRIVGKLRRSSPWPAVGRADGERLVPVEAEFSKRLSRGWGELSAMYGAPSVDAVCRECPAQDAREMVAAADDLHAGHFASAGRLPDAAGCSVTFADGSTGPLSDLEVGAESCQQIPETIWNQLCCFTDVRRGECIERCECPPEVVSYETRVGGHDRFLQGVPVFFQHVIPNACRDLLPGEPPDAFSGCGPVAGAMLATWFDSIGFTRLGADFREGGRLKWRDLVEEMGRQMGSSCSPCFCNPHQVYTLPVNFGSGLERFFSRSGLDVTVRKYKIKEEPRAGDPGQRSISEGWRLIKSELEADRPVTILYCLDDSCTGLGFKDIDFDLFLSHYGLVTGAYELDGKQFVHVDKGHGMGRNDVYEWDVPKGAVRLFVLEIGSGPGGQPDCIADYPDVEALADRFVDPFRLTWSPRQGTLLRTDVYYTDSARESSTGELGKGPWVTEHRIVPERCELQRDEERVEVSSYQIEQVRPCVRKRTPNFGLVIDCERTPGLFGCDDDLGIVEPVTR